MYMNKFNYRISLSKKIYFFSMTPFVIVLLVIGSVSIRNKIEYENELLLTRLNNYSVLLESGALSLESITQKNELENSLKEHVITAEIIKEDYTTPYTMVNSTLYASIDTAKVDRAFDEVNQIYFSPQDDLFEYLYPISYKGSVVALFHVSLLNKSTNARITEYILLVVSLYTVGLFASFLFIMFLVNKGILEKLSELLKGSKEITNGNLEYLIDVRSNDEIGDLGRSFNKMTKELRETIDCRDLLIKEVKERNIMLWESEQEVRSINLGLEGRVRKRTFELAISKEKAEAANRAKSTFLANMSHELRTPLNAILGFSSLMQNDSQIDNSQKKNLDIINRSGEHLLHLLNDILDMSKIEAGQVQLEIVPFDLGAMVRDVTDMMRVRAEDKCLQLLIDQSSEFPRYIVGDEARLRQILINLLGNAIKFTFRGSVTLRLGVRQNKPIQLLVEVEDTGIGITSEDQQHVFDPFVQLDERIGNKGTGLGLTITRQFVQMMSGTIRVESTPGKGSLFSIDLPLDVAKESEIITLKPAKISNVTGLAPAQPEYRILIVEDQYENQLLLAKLMESVGFQVRIAENGEQGVTLFQSWHPHFIWMDRRMPGMDGIEATRRIRELPEGNKVKIVAVTASAFIEQHKEMLAVGMDDYVRKPYRANEIYECLSRQLGVRYLYKDGTEQQEQDVILTPEMLNGLPERLLCELKEALESLEVERIEALIQSMAKHDKTLLESLNNLTANFNYPAILSVLQKRELVNN